MYEVANLKWTKGKNTKRYVFHLLDAPPHGRNFVTKIGDKFPNGCPCNKTHQEAIKNINELNVTYTIYKFTDLVDRTLDIFE